jgi:hypothetical protein
VITITLQIRYIRCYNTLWVLRTCLLHFFYIHYMHTDVHTRLMNLLDRATPFDTCDHYQSTTLSMWCAYVLYVKLGPSRSLVIVPPSHAILAYGVTEDAIGGTGAKAYEEASFNSVQPKLPIHEPTRGHLKAGLDCHLSTSSSRSHHLTPTATPQQHFQTLKAVYDPPSSVTRRHTTTTLPNSQSRLLSPLFHRHPIISHLPPLSML